MDVLYTSGVFFKPLIEINSSLGKLALGWVLGFEAKRVAARAAVVR